ncbi:MAG: alpha/beta fold hydrolase [Planctomycetes bacterium]|nr:alpha/beta fold hydrolase [Planctomycetota bacterium]
MTRRAAAVAATLAAGAAAASCSLWRLADDVEQIESHGIAAVQVTGRPAHAPCYVVAWAWVDGQRRLLGQHQARDDGRAWFVLELEHRYHFGAFADVDGDGAYDDGEPAASTFGVEPRPLARVEAQVTPVELRLEVATHLPLTAAELAAAVVEPSALGAPLDVQMGQLAPLDAERFGEAAGELGMWQPFEFLKRYGIGMWFVEPYDPARIPVVFVHGINAAPGDFAQLAPGIDRERFQVWLFQYPSGLRLASVEAALASSLLQLREHHEVPRVAIVAHSMGGLVARGAIRALAKEAAQDFVARLVTVSTPWGGHQAATIGVEALRHPVPAWRDMVPGSDYLRELLVAPLPEGLRHDLIFGFHSESGIGLPDDNDGVVGVQSELEPSVQATANSVFGLPFDHHAILREAATIERVRVALDDLGR